MRPDLEHFEYLVSTPSTLSTSEGKDPRGGVMMKKFHCARPVHGKQDCSSFKEPRFLQAKRYRYSIDSNTGFKNMLVYNIIIQYCVKIPTVSTVPA